MFVRHSVHVDRPYADCVRALVSSHGTWFPRLLDEVGGGDRRRLAAIGFPIAGVHVQKRVEVEIEEPSAEAARARFSWKPTFPRRLFPEFDGQVELAPVDPEVTRVTVSGTYVPPMGAVGRSVDEAVMHRAAEATVGELAEMIGIQLELAVAEKESVSEPAEPA